MTRETEELSAEQARKLVLLSQKIPPKKQAGSALAATLSTIKNLGYIQIDTISVVARAHHHTLWNRNTRYKPAHIDALLAEKKIFEYWSHAASYLPMRDYRFTLPRKQAILSGKQNHWYECDKRVMREVLTRVTCEGPLMAKDFENTCKDTTGWQTKIMKQALETLFMQGDLMISSRVNFHKVYDLTERVLPLNINSAIPASNEYARFLILRYLQANGLGKISEIAYLLKNIKPLLTETIKEMEASGEILKVKVKDNYYYALPAVLEKLSQQMTRSRIKILSPFDNLLIQRGRTQELFGYHYLLECYLPASKRRYGYFSLPILWDGRLVARMDCKAERKKSVFHINSLALEDSLKVTDKFIHALSKELKEFIQFNNCGCAKLHKFIPSNVKEELLWYLNKEPNNIVF